MINTLQILLEAGLKARRTKPLVEQRLGNINVTPECFDRMSAQEKPVKHGCFTLGSKWVEIVPELCVLHRKPPTIPLRPSDYSRKKRSINTDAASGKGKPVL